MNARKIGVWIAAVLPALLFLMTGFMKLSGAAEPIANFARWGYPDWFRLVIGTVEVLGAIGLLIPRISWIAAAVLLCNMLGAVVTHVRAHDPVTNVIVDVVVMILLAIVIAERRPKNAVATAS